MTQTTLEKEVTFKFPVSPPPKQIETAALEKVDTAVSPGQVSRPDSRERSDHESHWSQQHQKQKCSSPQNSFIYKNGIFVVLRIDKEISESNEPSFRKGSVLDVPKSQGEIFIRRLMVYWFDSTEESGREHEPLPVKYCPCF